MYLLVPKEAAEEALTLSGTDRGGAGDGSFSTAFNTYGYPEEIFRYEYEGYKIQTIIFCIMFCDAFVCQIDGGMWA